jgi:hypothetical protein
MSILSYVLYSTHLKNISSKASAWPSDVIIHYRKFIGMELLQYRKKKPQVTTKNCRTEPRSPRIPQNWTTLIPGGEIPGSLLSQKRFLSMKIKHRQSQTICLAGLPGFMKP